MESKDQVNRTMENLERPEQSTSVMEDCDILPGEFGLTDSHLDSMFDDFNNNDSVRTFDQIFGDIGSQQSDWRTESPMDNLDLAILTTFPTTTTITSTSSKSGTPLLNSPSIPNPSLHLSTETTANSARPPPKIGTRFSRESVSILRRWLSTHGGNPYPTDGEKEILQYQTGLSKTQISNWLANARRRSGARSTSSLGQHSSSRPVDIPRRPGTPAVDTGTRYLNPMERWVDSPPENEPATVTAIARAIASESSCADSPLIDSLGEYSSDKSLSDVFLGSSGGNSYSSGSSLSSAYSHGSRGSSRASSVLGRQRPRHKSRRSKRRLNVRTSLITPFNRYQCTFCTETFRTKHDWQRHEKSLHIPLERWVCAPDGPLIINQGSGRSYCAFCGEVDPNGPHVQSHNPSSCQERSFSRKDHLKQHLRLVHNATLVETLTRHWKVPTPDIRSRCGFCGISMDTWSFRVDHLADHFKMGQNMADWQGDWGFEDAVLNMVENSIPPYMIDMERHTPAPFMASQAPAESPRNAYELLKSELTWFLQTRHHNVGRTPTTEVIQLEACRIIFTAEVMMLQESPMDPTEPVPCSWLRDLITSKKDVTEQARFGPMRTQAESALSVPRLHGKATLFNGCPLEAQLIEFVRNHWALTQAIPTDSQLQLEARRIVLRIDQEPTFPRDDTVARCLIKLISSSTEWLSGFRKRVLLSLHSSEGSQTTHHATGSSSLHSLGRCPNCLTKEGELSQSFGRHGASASDMPDDIDGRGLEMKSSMTPADWSSPTLRNSYDNATSYPGNTALSTKQGFRLAGELSSRMLMTPPLKNGLGISPSALCSDCSQSQSTPVDTDHRPPWVKTCLYFFNDSNFYRWLARDLGRWVVATMSPNNPNRHVPSDEELRHQARCILYDDDDPWNPTAADNAEWLRRFKEEYGVIEKPEGLS